MNTPILLIIWRRPTTLYSLIETLRPLQPPLIYVASDGPVSQDKASELNVLECRGLIDKQITWPCEIQRLYSDINHGCSAGPIRAISWFFSQVTQGIILEDDCIPHPDFLQYCEALLDFYRDDSRVWCISGNNFQDDYIRGDGSYYFSRIPLIWGWATWRRCWQYYDATLANWPKLRESGLLQGAFHDPIVRSYWSEKWNLSFQNDHVNWWDYQWVYTCIAHGGLSVHPNLNLVNNIGTGPEATHTTGYIIPTPLSQERLDRIVHPSFILPDLSADQYLFDNVFGGHRLRRQKTIGYRVYHRTYRLYHKILEQARRIVAHAA